MSATLMIDRLIGIVRLAGFTGRTLLPHFLPRRMLRLLPVVTPERIVMSPPEMVTGDPSHAADIYAGYFILAGHAITADGQTIFKVKAPSSAWEMELHSFSWLTHLRANDTTLARMHARALIEEWIQYTSSSQSRMSSQITARRVMAWLVHAPFILEGASPKFHRRFLRSLARQVRRLRWEYATAPSGIPKLYSAMAQTMAGLCFADGSSILKVGTKRLSAELRKQILPDGTHISRNPAMILTVLGIVLPIKKMFISREIQPPETLLNAIDRMMPMVRFFQHGDGNFALFNGMGATPSDLVKAISSFDDAMGRPVMNAPHGGYQRLEGTNLVALIDTGKPPPLAVSHKAHAGTLSFELSSNNQRIVINCGVPDSVQGVWSLAARATAAHSTAGVQDASSSRFLKGKWLQALFGTPIISGPRTVTLTRTETGKGDVLRASHDGYGRRFGIIHDRTLRVAPDGTRVDGIDAFRPFRKRLKGNVHFTIRFHLHPDLQTVQDTKTGMIQITLPDGAKWAFATEGLRPVLEESVHLADPRGVRRTNQILLTGGVKDLPRVAWAFTQLG